VHVDGGEMGRDVHKVVGLDRLERGEPQRDGLTIVLGRPNTVQTHF
jgi:hypothetical protein